jgi:hypothetical protein
MQVYTSFSGCRNVVLSMEGWDTHSSALGLQTQHCQVRKNLKLPVNTKPNLIVVDTVSRYCIGYRLSSLPSLPSSTNTVD